MQTHSLKQKELKNKWVLVDAENQTLGRLATEIARVLRGKHRPSYAPHLDCGDRVIVVNAEKVRLTGNKWRDKRYYRHTGYIGGIKSSSAEEVRDGHPDRLFSWAVWGMMPKNKLSRRLMTNLKVYKGAEHPHIAQKPEPMPSRLKKEQ